MGKKRDRIRIVYCSIGGDYGGGIERMESYYYNHLDRDRFDPVFVVTIGRQVDRNPYDDSIPYIVLDFSNRFQGLLELIADADIVQFNGGLNPLVCHAARLSGVPVLVEVMHYTEPGQLYPWIDRTICVSETVRGVQPFRDKTSVVYNGIDLSLFPFGQRRERREKIVLLEVSRREKKKHFHLYQLKEDILSINPSVEIWMVGRGQTGISDDVVRFMGVREDISRIYQDADIFVLLSEKEPFGLVILEAMASGCLPIVADDGGGAEIVTNGVDGWVVSADNIDSVLWGIKDAISIIGSDRWEEMRANARRKVNERFRIDQTVKGYEEIYLELIEEKGRRKESGGVEFIQPSEIDIEDALAYFRAGDIDAMMGSLKEVANKDDRIDVEILATIADGLARLAVAYGERDVGLGVLNRLYSRNQVVGMS